MRFEYDWYLIEEAVFREMRRRETAGKVEDYLAYRRSLDRIYEARRINAPDVESGAVTRPEPTRADGSGLDEALRREHLACFRRLGFWRVIAGLVEEYPLLGRGIDLLSLQAAERRRAEAAELFVREEDANPEELVRTLVLSIYPESFLDLPRLRAFLRRELCHISDMLDPAFGYRPDLGSSACTAAQENLVRDRYAVLWDIYAESRNVRTAPAESRPPGRNGGLDDLPPRLRALAGRAFAGLPEAAIEDSLRRVWTGENITHDELVALAAGRSGSARAALKGAGASAGETETGAGRALRPPAGAPCPACGFPTHRWVPTREGYACLQCTEMLDAAAPAG